jgi:hypothetical protein
MIFIRWEKSIKGYLCKSCITGYFWEYTLASLALGWWGFISLMANPLIILNNVFRFLTCLFMPRARAGRRVRQATSRASCGPTCRRCELGWTRAPGCCRSLRKPPTPPGWLSKTCYPMFSP